MRVLIVDDEDGVRSVVRRSLEREGFETGEAADGAAARAAFAGGGFEVVVLDIHLPDTSGLALLADLRSVRPDVHVIMLTGAGSEADRVLGLVSGADDYVVKPFSPRELAARVIAVARHRRAAAPVIRHGDLVIDIGGRVVTLAGRPVDLTRREFELLSHLASHPGQAFSREQLLESVWESSASWQQPATVTEHVRRLRSKLEIDPNEPQLLQTVRGMGYRFAGVAELDASIPAAASAASRSEDATVVIVGTDIRFASPAAIELLGASAANEVIGHDVFEFVAPQSIGASRARQESARSGHWPRPELITIRRADGRDVVVELASGPVVWDGEGASQVTMWEIGDDTARLRQLATGIQSDVSDAVVLTDDDLRIRSFNRAAEELYEWSEQEVLGRTLADTIGGPAEPIEAAYDGTLGQLGSLRREEDHRRADGSTVRVRSSLTVVRDGGGLVLGLVSVNRPLQPVSEGPGPSPGRDALDREIRAGIDRNEFVVHYQPIVSLANGRVGGVEALVRWAHPTRGLLAPAEFIDAAERSGAIVDLGEHVLMVACEQARSWRAAGLELHVAVNLSARQLADHRFADRLDAVMAETRMPPAQLWLEVTETSLVQDIEQAARTLDQIDAHGARIVIDDFGTGWASLTYLREFPVHALKIDRSFVSGLGASPRDEAIVRSTLALGYELDLVVVAEGVETAEQAAILESLGCLVAQGYLFGRPAPSDVVDLRAEADRA